MKNIIVLLSFVLAGCECGANAEARAKPNLDTPGHKNIVKVVDRISGRNADDGFWKYEDKNIICYYYFYNARPKTENCRWKIPQLVKYEGLPKGVKIVPTVIKKEKFKGLFED